MEPPTVGSFTYGRGISSAFPLKMQRGLLTIDRRNNSMYSPRVTYYNIKNLCTLHLVVPGKLQGIMKQAVSTEQITI